MNKVLAVDTETTGLNTYGGDKITVVSFCDGAQVWADRPEAAAAALDRYLQAGYTIVMHNGIFDRAVFKQNFGIEIPDDQYRDTMAIDWLLDENRDHRLKEGLGSRLFGTDAKAEQDALKALMRGETQADVYKSLREVENALPRSEREPAAQTRERARAIAAASKRTWADLTFEELQDYAVQDATLTYDVYEYQVEIDLADDPYVLPYMQQLHDVMSLTYRINDTGIAVSAEAIEKGLQEAQVKVDALGEKFAVNLRSPTQVAELLYDTWGLPVQGTTDSGGRSTDKAALNNLAYDPRVKELIEYRKLVKQVDAYFRPLLEHVGNDGRIHPTLHPCRTTTGRWSASQPNLQTIPRESTSQAIRDVFVASEGMELIEIDLSQIEVRIAADLAQEHRLLEVYKHGGDVYQSLADDIGVSRQVAKTVILSAQYGVGPKTLAQSLALGSGTRPNIGKAKNILAAYWRNYPNLKRLFDRLAQDAEFDGWIPLWKPGRRRLYNSPHLRFPRYYTALNATIQGGAAELLKDVLLQVEPEVRHRGLGRVVLTVHDSVVFEVLPGSADECLQLVTEITNDVSPFAVDTPWEVKPW